MCKVSQKDHPLLAPARTNLLASLSTGENCAAAIQTRQVEYGGHEVWIQEGALGDGLGARVWIAAHILCRSDFTPTLNLPLKELRMISMSQSARQISELNTQPCTGKVRLRYCRDCINQHQFLNRYLILKPSLVAGQDVLELGSGCGLCGILAAKLGASGVSSLSPIRSA